MTKSRWHKVRAWALTWLRLFLTLFQLQLHCRAEPLAWDELLTVRGR